MSKLKDINVNVVTGEIIKTFMTSEEEMADNSRIANNASINNWMSVISQSPMNRIREDFITHVMNGIADSPEEQVIYDAKVALRATKPE